MTQERRASDAAGHSWRKWEPLDEVGGRPVSTAVADPPRAFEVADGWYTVTLGDLLPEWGEGASETAAIEDMVGLIWSLHNELHGQSDDRLSEHLCHQRTFLCALARGWGKHP